MMLLTDQDIYHFREGTFFRAYEKLGAHLLGSEATPQGRGTHFAVWAPNASAVSVVGDFNAWQRDAHPLQARATSIMWHRGSTASRPTRATRTRSAPSCRRAPLRSSGISATNGATRHGWRSASNATHWPRPGRSTNCTWARGGGYLKSTTARSTTANWHTRSPTM